MLATETQSDLAAPALRLTLLGWMLVAVVVGLKYLATATGLPAGLGGVSLLTGLSGLGLHGRGLTTLLRDLHSEKTTNPRR